MNNIVWIASYPKSGNTWTRVFLTNLQRDGEEPANINNLDTNGIASARAIFDELVGLEASDLTPDEIDCLRPEMYLQMAAEATEMLFVKIHDAYLPVPDGRPLIPADATHSVLYILRNPLDVAVSFAHHSHRDLETMIAGMNDPNYTFCAGRKRLTTQLRQKLLSWSGHVRSWVDASELRLKVIRYEDMVQHPEDTFRAMAEFVGLPHEPERVQKALQFSSFEELQRQEEEHGFREKAPHASSFFRKGKVGDWCHTLTGKQVQQLVKEHRDVMQRFGYFMDTGALRY